jgi:hypothetical protein
MTVLARRLPLAALFISSEVGCEGVRWLSTNQLAMWPVLVPARVARADRTEVLNAYRLFRKLEAKEIPAMDEVALVAWLALTEAVARAAGLKHPRAMAESCLALARETCERRARRETLALAGRLRKSGSKGRTLARHVHDRLEANPQSRATIDNLTQGDVAIRLRATDQLAQIVFDFGDNAKSVPGEAALAEALGEGFECAPVPNRQDPEYLARDIRELIDSLVQSLVGARPDKGDPSLATYEEMAGDVHDAAVKWLRHEVEKRLS